MAVSYTVFSCMFVLGQIMKFMRK